RDSYALALVDGMDERATADINTVVREAGHIGVREEHRIAGLKVAQADPRTAVELAPHAARNVDAGDLVDVPDEAGAVEASRRRPAEHVAIAQVPHRVRDDPTASAAHYGWGDRQRGGGRLRRDPCNSLGTRLRRR